MNICSGSNHTIQKKKKKNNNKKPKQIIIKSGIVYDRIYHYKYFIMLTPNELTSVQISPTLLSKRGLSWS